jgi:hypothetical protein
MLLRDKAPLVYAPLISDRLQEGRDEMAAPSHDSVKWNKSKVIPATGRGGLYGCEMPKIPHFLDKWITDGDEVVSLTRRPHFTPRMFWYSFLLEAHWTPGPMWGCKDLGKLKTVGIAGYVSVCVQLYCMLVSTVFHYIFRPTWPSSSV